jgi:hypothetical protein
MDAGGSGGNNDAGSGGLGWTTAVASRELDTRGLRRSIFTAICLLPAIRLE